MPSASSSTATARPVTREALELTARLWHHFASCFPHRWIPAVGGWAPDNPAVQSWAIELHGLTDDQVAKGVAALRAQGRDWPPGAFEFASLCRADGIPPVDDAYHEAVMAACGRKGVWGAHPWSHPVVYHATIAVGRWELRTLPAQVAERKFAAAYQRMRERWNAGEPLEAPEPLALPPPPPPPPPDPAVAAAHLEQIAGMLGRRETTTREGCPDCGGTGQRLTPIRGAERLMPCMSCLLAGTEHVEAQP